MACCRVVWRVRWNIVSRAAAAAAAEGSGDGVNVVKMEVNEALEKLGTIGRWQILHYTVLSTASCITSCVHIYAIIYIGKNARL